MIAGWIAGVDVSSHQRPSACDWSRARAAGLDFAYVKLTEGTDYLDPAAEQHLERLGVGGPGGRGGESDDECETERGWHGKVSVTGA